MPQYWEVEDENIIFFWGGCFSNWAAIGFQARLEENSQLIEFNRSEQYMMAVKAHLFQDSEALVNIMNSNDPAHQKALGRGIKGYSDEVWNPVARDLTYPGVYAKFTQNTKYKNLILSTKGKFIVEASAVDTKWGIGLAPNDPKNADRKNWRGLNWLGQIVMKVRDDIDAGINSSFTTIDWSPYEH